MHNQLHTSALLENIAGAKLPPLAVDIPAQFQFCVNAGAAAASNFLADSSAVLMHDHIALAPRSFAGSVGAGMAATGDYDPEKMIDCRDAFTAGYLGRLQQALTQVRDDGTAKHSTPSAPSFAVTKTNTIN